MYVSLGFVLVAFISVFVFMANTNHEELDNLFPRPVDTSAVLVIKCSVRAAVLAEHAL